MSNPIAYLPGHEPRDSGAEPPDNGGMEARVATLEAIVPTLATREDMAKMHGSLREDMANLRAEMHREFNTQTWRMIGAMLTFGSLLTAAVYFIARTVH